ncbi:4'-phosphopantetheinyl transferase family protein [Bacillus massiliglaciei]|uniref:4'-phosphopantetheinyl transferase family protein n=1 Tax=Bacillus massiliglaciei TaxID=1816693 RepID=UPI0018FE0E5A|nr:4'-phosphopantetheinyl transferase superfamily protein [Bacillus massiliglaciei]
MCQVYACRLPEQRESWLLDEMLKHLPFSRQNRIRRLHHLDDAFRSATGNLLLRYLIQNNYGLHPEQISFGTNKYGKPKMEGPSSIAFNLSHSGDWAVCAIGKEEVGIDIEKENLFPQNLAKSIFSEEERSDCRNQELYGLWTIKESYLKAVGTGLLHPMQSFFIQRGQSGEIKLADAETKMVMEEAICRQYEIEGGYQMAVCSISGCPERDVIHISCSDIMESLKYS